MGIALFVSSRIATEPPTLYEMVNEEASVTWVRNFDTETESPIEGQTTGQIPEWLEGALIRNGSGIYQIGITSMKHLFDGMAVIHRFGISKGKATYQNRILKSDTYLESKAANRLTVMQFGTNSTPDPCKSLFGKFMSHFEIPTPEGLTDNCGVNVVSYGDALYAVTESHKIRKIDPKTLETLGEKTNLRKYVAVNMVTAHPHIDEDGTVYNMGNSIGANGSAYNIIEFPPGDASFTEAKIVATIPDDGLILFSALHQTDLKRVLLVILDASTFEEVSCTEFIAKGTVTKDFHGVFASDSDNFYRF